MTIPSATPEASDRILQAGIVWLQRLAGLALFAVGVAYWIRLVGVFPGPNWRFDLMSPEWRAAASMLAVLCPVAGVGLWLAASWGIVVWMLVAAVELVMHTAFQPTFGGTSVELVLVLVGLALMTAFRLVRWLRARGRRSQLDAG